MKIMTKGNQVLGVYPDTASPFPNKEQNEVLLIYGRVLETPELTHMSGPRRGFKDVSEIFTFSEIQEMKINAVKVHYGDLITEKYPVYKQMNIARLAAPYTQDDLDEMNNFIDGLRNKSNNHEAALKAIDVNLLEGLLLYNIYE